MTPPIIRPCQQCDRARYLWPFEGRWLCLVCALDILERRSHQRDHVTTCPECHSTIEECEVRSDGQIALDPCDHSFDVDELRAAAGGEPA